MKLKKIVFLILVLSSNSTTANEIKYAPLKPPPRLDMIVRCSYNRCRDVQIPSNDCFVRSYPYQDFAFYLKDKFVLGSTTGQYRENHQIISNNGNEITYGRRYDADFYYNETFRYTDFKRRYEKYKFNWKNLSIRKEIYYNSYRRYNNSKDLDRLEFNIKFDHIEYTGKCSILPPLNEPI